MGQPEQLKDGRYRVQQVLGEGAQGVTYAATDGTTGAQVAIKRFNVANAQQWKEVELADREARVLATLDHPLVPRYVDQFEEAGGLYLVMEKVEGETLEAIRKREGALPEAEVRRFLACADRALSYLHGRASPVVHRDIKPRNIVRRPDGSYVFVDFGAVSELLTRRGGSTIVGTYGYMAPEQLQGRASPTTDVYAVGATAIAALAGVEPETLPHRGLRLDVRTALGERVSPSLLATLERMVEPDPDLRPATVAAALDGMNSGDAGGRPGPTASPLAAVSRGPAVAAPAPADGAGDAAPLAVFGEDEDALVKSLKKLIWTLWGLSWVLVPVVLARVGARQLVPEVMFGSLAGLLILFWHKAALLRLTLRQLGVTQGRLPVRHAAGESEPVDRTEIAPPGAAGSAGSAGSTGPRALVGVRVEAPGVRVRTSEAPPSEEYAATEVATAAGTGGEARKQQVR